MRALVWALALWLGAAGSGAAQSVTERIGRDGLSATERHLQVNGSTPSDLFALGGVRFLRGIERALQTRYRHGLSDASVNLPLLRLPLPDNPAPEPFRPGLVSEIFAQAADDMARAREPLAHLRAGDRVAVVIDTADLWFDIDGNGRRGPDESALAFLATIPPQAEAVDSGAGVVTRFDTADVAWLMAYTHLVSGAAELVRAWDPTDAIAEVMVASARFETLSGDAPYASGWFSTPEFARFADVAAIAHRAVGRPADPRALAAARDHFLAMVEQNHRFWRLVRAETDNDREWIPNAAQTSALPIEFPPETGTAWLAVLDELAAVLRGDLLIPHWRLRGKGGIDLSLLVADAPALSLIGLVQGVDVAPYVRRGPVASGRALRAFRRLTGRDMPLFVLALN